MIRRFYILPLRHGVTAAQIDALLGALRDAGRFIPGVVDSAAALDLASPTVIWENGFVDAETYSGPYMTHPYHGFTLDNYVMADSPECLTHDIYTTRYELPAASSRLTCGVRRLLLMNLPDDADISILEASAAASADIASSALCRDNVRWVSVKGRPWTHIWEQGFVDVAALDRHLATREGIGTASIEGLARFGIAVRALRIFTYPVAVRQAPPPPPWSPGDGPVSYEITARVAVADADAYLAMLESLYDRYVAAGGGRLIDRLRTVAGGCPEVTVRSTWELASMTAYADLRARTATDADWARFVQDAMPLVQGGSRRFYEVHRPASRGGGVSTGSLPVDQA